MWKIVFLIILFISCNTDNNNEKIRPRLTEITESVYASVTVRPEEVYMPQTIRSGIIKRIEVEEGDIINQGQMLFQISTTADITNRLTRAELDLKEAKANYEGQDNKLINIETEIQALKDQLALDSVNLERHERLWKQNVGRQVDVDQARLKFQSTKSQIEILESKYAQTLISLENIYNKSLNQVEAERNQLGDYIIRSKIDGQVYTIYKEVGELISTQEAFAEIGSENNFLIEMDIDEEDISKIEMRDTISISLYAYPDDVFIAYIDKIFPKKNDVTQTFRVQGRFYTVPPKLYNGLSGEANIIIDRKEHAIIIPSDYLITNNKVLTSDGEVDVHIGMKNMEFAEILSGVDTSTILIKPEK